MFRRGMTLLGRRCAEVLENEHANRAGPAAGMAAGLDLADQFTDPDALSLAYFVQRVPEFRFQTHTGASPARHHISVNQSFRHDRPL